MKPSLPPKGSRKGFLKRFAKDLKNEIKDDNVSNGAAALAYYLMLSIFPAMIALLTLLPFLPIPNLAQAVTDLLNQALPPDAAGLFLGTIQEVMSQRQGGLLSIGLLFTLWAASNGMYAIMQQLNITYDVTEGRPFWKVRGTALLMTVLFGALIAAAFGLIVMGGTIQSWLGETLGAGPILLGAFALARWAIILGAILLAFSIMYYFGPDVDQKFLFVTPGSIAGTAILIVASIGFRIYVTNFGKYNATYGSIGAVIVLMLWLYITGMVLLLGSEVNALLEHYSPEGKQKGEKKEKAAA